MKPREFRGSSLSRQMARHGVVSFTLKNPAESMASEDILSAAPEAVVRAILRRRERLAKELPQALQQRHEENDRAYALTKQAKQDHEASLQDKGDDNDPSAAVYEENEAFRRRTVSRLWTAKHASADTAEALAFWKEMTEGGWGHLLEDAKRVEAGGPSSYALKKRTTIDTEESV